MSEPKINVYKIQSGNLENKVAIITTWKDFNYVEKMNNDNTFSLTLAATNLNDGKNSDFFDELFKVDLDIRNNKYIIEVSTNKKQVGIITSIKLTSGEKPGQSTLIVEGKGLTWLFESRVISPGNKLNSEGNLHYNNNLMDIISDLFIYFRNGQVASTGLKENATIDSNKILSCVSGVDFVGTSTGVYSFDFRLKNMQEIIIEILQNANARNEYFYIYAIIVNDKIRFKVEKGLNISNEIKFDNLNRKNAKGLEITRDISGEYNGYISAGQGEGKQREFYTNSTKSDASFKEVYVNASDVGQDDTNSIDIEGTLRSRGQEAIEESKEGESVTYAITSNSAFLPWEDFKVGDIIAITYEFPLEEEKYKLTLYVPIIEIGYDYTGSKIKYDVKVGDVINFTKSKERIESKNNKINSRR